MSNYTIFAAASAATAIWFDVAYPNDPIEADGSHIVMTNQDGTVTVISGTGFAYDADGFPIAGVVNSVERWESWIPGVGGTTLFESITGLNSALADMASQLTFDGIARNFWFDVFTTESGPVVHNATVLVFQNTDSTYTYIRGNGFTYDDNGLTGGTVTAVEHYLNLGDPTPDDSLPIPPAGVAAVDLQQYFETPMAPVLLDVMSGNDVLTNLATTGEYVLPALAGSDTVNGSAANEMIFDTGGNDTIVGGGGIDTIDYSLDAQGAVIRLDLGTAIGTGIGSDNLTGISYAVGTQGADTIVGTTAGNHLSGESGSDLLYGAGGSDILSGGAGGDHLWGGDGADQHIGGDDTGIDYARYDDANWGNLTIRLDGGANVGAAAIGDTYSGIEGLVGGAGNDTVYGNVSANYLFGQGGTDYIYASGGADYLNGGTGGDHLWGGLGADQHIGGDDSGIDYARYDDANYGNLTIRLDGGANVGAAAVGDTYTGIEGLVGGAGNDSVYGNASANYLFGQGGTDYIYGAGGADYLNGGTGGDHLWGGLGADQHIGGDDAGIDYARYDDANYGNLTIRLDGFANAGAAAVGDTYNGIEGLVGGLGSDIVVGNASNNYLFGGGAADFLYGLGGNDYLNGGAGADRFIFATALGAGNVDTIADFAHLTDSIVLNTAIFAAVGPTLTVDELAFGAAAVDTNDFIIYNSATGQLFYDANGSTAGGAGQIQFATVTAGTTLTHDDFIVA